MEKTSKNYPLALGGLSIVLMGVSVWVPWTIFIALAPIMGIMDYFFHKQGGRAYRNFAGFILLFMILAFTARSVVDFGMDDPTYWVQGLGFGAMMSLAFYIFWYTQKTSKNRIGYFTLILFWLALEYLEIKINLFDRTLVLARTLEPLGAIMSWNHKTGYLGGSLWILMVNVLVYYALLRDKAILVGTYRWALYILIILAIGIPLIIGLISEAQPIGFQMMADLYQDGSPSDGNFPEGFDFYFEHYEYLGRTGGWVSLLIIIFAFVKGKTARKNV